MKAISYFLSYLATTARFGNGVDFWSLALAFAILSCFFSTRGLAQDPAQAFDQAQALFDSGDYPKAAEAFEEFSKNYPTSAQIFAAKLRLAYALFLSQQFEKAGEVAKTLQSQPTTPDIIERAYALVPQITSAKANELERGTEQWEALLKKANEEFTEFIKKYSQSPSLDQAFYGRALNSVQLKKFDEAISDLRQIIEKFPKSPLITDTKYLLALALNSKAVLQISKGNPDRNAVETLFAEAEKIFRDLIAARENLAVANDAAFQLGDLLIGRATLYSGDDESELRKKNLDEAISSFRSVLAKEPLIAAQEQRIAKLREDFTAAQRARNLAEVERIREAFQFEIKRLGGLKTRPDQRLSALLKVGEVLYRRNEWNGLRVMMNYLKPFATTAEELKMVLYYTAVSYAGQMHREKAEASYAAFKERFQGADVAMNLPLLMSNMYLNSQPVDPNRAIELLQEAQTTYPDSPFADQTALQEAQALLGLSKFDEALNRFSALLAKNPSAEITISATFGMAQANELLGRLEEAIGLYKKVRDANSDSKLGENSHFQVALLNFRKNNQTEALAEFESFISKYPESSILPNALFFKALTLQALNKTDEALTLLTEIPQKFKDNDIAPYSFFQRASVLQTQNRLEEMNNVMREFIQTYPNFQDEPSKTLFFNAHDILGSNLGGEGKLAEAILIYEEYVERRKDDPNAALALLKISALSRQRAESMGRFLALNENERSSWKEYIAKAVDAAEKVLENYSSTPTAAGALQALIGLQKLLVSSDVIKPEGILQYFENLASKYASKTDLKNKILFTLASHVAETDAARALQIRKSAYNESLLYAPADLEGFGLALLENGEVDEADKVFEKLANDYPNPEGVEPQMAGPDVVRAQAGALFGKGMVFKKRGDDALAKENFTKLKELYPFSDKVIEASIALAEGYYEQGRAAEALGLLSPIIAQSAAPSALRSKALFLGGQVHAKNGDLALAVDFFSKCAAFFSEEKANAAAALLMAGELSEQIAASEVDAKKKAETLLFARRSYNDLVTKYPDSPEAPKANQRLAALGGLPGR